MNPPSDSALTKNNRYLPQFLTIFQLTLTNFNPHNLPPHTTLTHHLPRLPHHSNPPLHPHPLPSLILLQIHSHLPHILEPTSPIQRMAQPASIDIASQPRGVGVRESPADDLGSGSFAFVIGVGAEEPEH